MKKILLTLLLATFSLGGFSNEIKVMLLTGHTDKYHNWEIMSTQIKATLDEYKPFKTTVVTDYQDPTFEGYDVVIVNINQVEWSAETKQKFEAYVSSGGGVVIVHEANNAFPEWEEYNKMIGLGGWAGRTEKHGDYYYMKDGKFVRDNTPGKAGKHGKRVPFDIEVYAKKHPIMKGLPKRWTHSNDELYGNMRGPAENMEVLATGFSDKATGGTGKQEPVLLTITYGKGRIFHTMLGHTKAKFTKAVENRDFQVTLSRGTEWAATGRVKQKTKF